MIFFFLVNIGGIKKKKKKKRLQNLNQILEMTPFKAIILLSFSLFALSDGLYDTQTDIVHLTESNFNSLVLNTEDAWLIEFYGNSSLTSSPLVWTLQVICT